MKAFVNGLSIFRIVAAFALLPLVFLQLWGAALIVFVLASVSDFLDGFLARKFNAVSKFGGVLDHTGDKFLVVISLIVAMLAVQTPYMISLVVIMILRDIYVSGLREFMGGQKIALPVDKLGKLKTMLQMTALSVFFVFFYIYMNDIFVGAHIYVLDAALVLLGLAAAVAVFSAIRYTIVAIGKIKK